MKMILWTLTFKALLLTSESGLSDFDLDEIQEIYTICASNSTKNAVHGDGLIFFTCAGQIDLSQ